MLKHPKAGSVRERPWQYRFAKIWDAVSIVCISVTGLIVGVLHFFPSLKHVIPAEPVILVLLGAIGAHFAIERFSTIRRIEEKLEHLNTAASLAEFSAHQQEVHRRATKAYIDVQQIISKLTSEEQYFVRLADELLAPADTLLRNLAEGLVVVPPYQTAAAHEKLSALFSRRFDAVCEEDIDFWDQSTNTEEYFLAEAYLRIHGGAIKRRTAHTRIFIVTLRDLIEHRDRLVRILTRHQNTGIGWGVAIAEELEEPLRTTSGRLDFALFDSGRALSYFQQENPHRFEAVLNLKCLPANNDVIRQQIDIHQRLIAECWIASDAFVRDYPNIHGERANKRVREMMCQYNNYLKAVVADVSFEHQEFVFVVGRSDETDTKLLQLTTLLNRYRRGRGTA